MATKSKKKSIRPASKAKAMPRRKSRKPQTRHRVRTGGGSSGKFVLPLFISACIIACLVFLGVTGYRTVTASDFFDVKAIDIRGVDRTSRDDIQKIIASRTEKTGSWNADLPDLRQKIEKLPFVKTAAVSRVLPNGIRVNIAERIPIAIVRLNGGDFLIDNEATILAPVAINEPMLSVILRGWDEAKTEKASKDNLQRIKLYQKMLSDWSSLELAKRVKEVNLSDLQEPKVVIEDSGSQIPVLLAKDNYAKSLKAALEAVAGKGEKIKSVNSGGVYPVIEYMGY